MRWTDEQYQKYIAARNKPAVPATNVEPNTCNGVEGKKKVARLHGLYDVEIISYISRLRDPDGTSAKYAIDSIVSAGILQDDNAKFIREIKHRQVKIKKGAEKTQIIFTAVDWEMEKVLKIADEVL